MWNPNLSPGDTSSGETTTNRWGSLHGEPQKYLRKKLRKRTVQVTELITFKLQVYEADFN